jgi:hypothetical protein
MFILKSEGGRVTVNHNKFLQCIIAYLQHVSALVKNTITHFYFFCLTDQRWANAPPTSLPALSRTSRLGELYQSMTGARRTIAEIITIRKSNKILLERLASACRSSTNRNTQDL